LKTKVSAPASPRTRSEPSFGFHVKVSLPLPRKALSAPPLPSTTSSPRPPRKVSFPLPPMNVSSPSGRGPGRLGRGERAVAGVEPDPVVAVAGPDVDGVEGAEPEGEVGRPVVADVDLEPVRMCPADAQGDPVLDGVGDDQCAVDDLGLTVAAATGDVAMVSRMVVTVPAAMKATMARRTASVARGLWAMDEDMSEGRSGAGIELR
jgi:hypothetical protein